jgi:NTP pyrophosphatase (non-canonical NTP hydrolase)
MLKQNSSATRSRTPVRSKKKSQSAKSRVVRKIALKGKRPSTKEFECITTDERAYRGGPFNTLGREIHVWAKGKGWWRGKAGRAEGKLLLMHAELSELVEELRDGRRQTEVYFKRDKHKQRKPEGVPIEAADLLIRLLDYCSRYQIDIDRAVELKMLFNGTRPYRHGGKAF